MLHDDRLAGTPCRLARFGAALALGLGALVCSPSDGRAQDAVGLVQEHLYAGTLAAGENALAPLARQNASDDNARFGLAGLQFFRAVERLAQGLYRHGLEAPRSGIVPILRMPVRGIPTPRR